jgi:transcriptional regulator with XRE-family HTH domain
MHPTLDHWLRMSFPARLNALRKQHGLTQQGLADALGMHLSQIKRYENGTSQPTLEALKRIALRFNITTDELIFDDAERSPPEDLRLHFEAVRQLAAEDQKTVLNVIDGLMLKHQAQTWGPRREVAANESDVPSKPAPRQRKAAPRKRRATK